MSIWILRSAVPAETPKHAEGVIQIPVEGIPDYHFINHHHELRAHLKKQHPEFPPERISAMTDRIWHLTRAIGREDIIAVPVKEQSCAVFAEALKRPHYDAETAHYVVPVRWYGRRVPYIRFGKHRKIFEEGKGVLREVQDPQARAAIRGKLPVAGNRFGRWRWVLAIVIAIQMFYLLQRLWQTLAIKL